MNRFLLSIILLLLLPLVATAADDREGSSVEELFSLANLAYADGRYEEAIKSYGDIAGKGLVNPDVYYNLGNAYAKAGEKGKAIHSYEKSLELLPDMEDTRYNLALIKSQLLIDNNKVDARSPLEKIAASLSFNASAKFFLTGFSVLFLALTAIIMTDNKILKKSGSRALLIISALTIFSGSFSAYKLYLQERNNEGIIISNEATLYEVPMEQGKAGYDIPEGLKVTIMNKGKDWLKVSTSDGIVGWLKVESVGLI